MDVFIGNLPAEAGLIELGELLEGRPLPGHYERRSGQDCFGKSYHYYVVYVDSADQGWELIEQLNGKNIAGTRIRAREFMQRVKGHATAPGWRQEERRINPVEDQPRNI